MLCNSKASENAMVYASTTIQIYVHSSSTVHAMLLEAAVAEGSRIARSEPKRKCGRIYDLRTVSSLFHFNDSF